MLKHTPGPWKFETVLTSVGHCHKIGPFPWKHDKQNHACIYVNYPNHDGRGLFEDELAANARLIAAAPDLLEALKDLKVRYESLFNIFAVKTYSPSSDSSSDLELALTTCNRAIAKATGEPS
jgi:hypothetical protein